MKYLIAILFPFVPFFYIKKPVSGYICFVLQVFVLLSASFYPHIMILFILWFLLDLWAFFEINDYNNTNITNNAIKLGLNNLAKVNSEGKSAIHSSWNHNNSVQSSKEPIDIDGRLPINIKGRNRIAADNRKKDLPLTKNSLSHLSTIPYRDYKKSRGEEHMPHVLDDNLHHYEDDTEDYRYEDSQSKKIIPVRQAINNHKDNENFVRDIPIRYNANSVYDDGKINHNYPEQVSYDAYNRSSDDHHQIDNQAEYYHSDHPNVVRSKKKMQDKYLLSEYSSIPDYARYDRRPRNYFNHPKSYSVGNDNLDAEDNKSSRYSRSNNRYLQNNKFFERVMPKQKYNQRSSIIDRRRRDV